jgi:DNA-directed RNA polymerase subunit omega
MMIYPSVDELMKKYDSRYSVVIAAAKRARELEDKENPTEPLIKTKSEKPVTIAVEEIYEGKIDFTKYKALNIRFDVSLIAPNCLFSGYLKNELGAVCTDGTQWFLVAENTGYYHENVVRSVDISDLNGLYVPYFAMYSGGCATIYEVWLERE